MIKTININLSGIVYHINEDAYDKLNSYLKSIRAAFRNTEGGDEIIADIESRVAEIFNEKLGSGRQVVEMADVEEMIGIMGLPEDYELEEDEDQYYGDTTSTIFSKKRLFRDPDNKILGGVSSGIAAYLDVDPLWIRFLWIIMLFGYGFGFLLYIILWMIIPEARTTAEKLEMKGEPVNIENIEKKIKEEFENIRNSFSQMSDHAKSADYRKAGKKAQSVLAHSLEVFFSIVNKILTVIFKIIGLVLIIAGIMIIPALIFGTGFGFYSIDAMSQNGNVFDLAASVFNTPLQMKLAIILAILTAIIPIVLIIMLGVRILSGKSRVNYIGIIVIVTIWFAAATGIAVIATDNSLDFNTKSSITEQESLKFNADTIIVKSLKSDYTENEIFDETDFWAYTREGENGNELLFNEFNFDIQKSRTSSFELRVKKYARGRTKQAALDRVKEIDFSYKTKGNQLILNDYFSTPIDNKLRDQEVRTILFIPVGTTIYIDKNMDGFINSIDNQNDYWGYQMLGHYWLMTEDGLECTDCEKEQSDDEFYGSLVHKSDSVISKYKDFNFTVDSFTI